MPFQVQAVAFTTQITWCRRVPLSTDLRIRHTATTALNFHQCSMKLVCAFNFDPSCDACRLMTLAVHGNVGTSLPGCNNIVSGPAPAGPNDNKCPAGGNNPTPTRNSYPAQTPIVRASPTPGQATGNTGFVYAGCFDDNMNHVKTIKSPHTFSDPGMTIQKCQSYCSGFNPPYKYAGLEFGDECYCGNNIQTSPAANQTYCTMHCAGDQTQ